MSKQGSKTPGTGERELDADGHQKCRTEIKWLRNESKEAQATITRLSTKIGQLRQRVLTSRTQELALRQYNRMLLTMVTNYMDREANLLSNTRTIMQAYPIDGPLEKMQDTIHEVFDG